MEEIASILLQIFVLLLFAKLMGGLFEKYHMPKLIGEIIAGAIFINLVIFVPAFGDFLSFDISVFNRESSGDPVNFFHIMGEIGIIFLLFAVGLETRFSDMKKVGRTASYIAILGIAIPFAGGMLFIFWDNGMIDFNAALLIGAALFGSSTAVGVECLRNLDAMNTNEAKLIVSATIIDDILCLALIGVIIGTIKESATTLSIVLNTVMVAAFVLLMFFFVSRIKKLAGQRKKRMQQRSEKKYEKIKKSDPDAHIAERRPVGELGALGIALLVCIGLAAFSASIGLAAIIGAFLAGMIFAEFKDTVPIEHNFNVITYFMLPFFFIWVGMELQFNRVPIEILPMFVALLIVAIVTKYVAGYFGGRLGKLSHESCHLIGVSFVPRGEVGIIVATIGLGYGVFKTDVFTAVILMALVTSMIVPPLMTHGWRKLEKKRAAAFEEVFMEVDDGDLDND
ncbi:MAG: cation:proton antiporter [Methanomassiliicoccaceae archaeon]|jgi:Kef-type K+ transport system membrane component KefB|nr:cation:proton antiporter [Methanomassiliicoccaceae archaeon]